MVRCMQNVGLRPEDMHGFIVGSRIVEIGNENGGIYEVVSFSGLLKTDYLQLDSDKSAWVIAGDYR